MIFENRKEAGKKLAAELYKLKNENPFVLAMPRGGVPIGFEVAEVLQAPLDVIIVRKIGLSGNKEFGIGAIAEGGIEILDDATIEMLGIDELELKDVIEFEKKELVRRVEIYRGDKKLPDLSGKTAVLIDDGMATGITAKAGIKAVKKLNPQKLVLASPVCALDTVRSLRDEVDEVVCLVTPQQFSAVGVWYRNFEQISDSEVADLLKKART